MSTSQNHVTVTDSSSVTTEIISTSDIGTVALVENVETTTTTTTKTTTTVQVSPTVEDKGTVKTIEPGVVVGTKQDGDTSRESSPNENVQEENIQTQTNDSSQQNGENTSQKSESKVIVLGSDGKQSSGIMNIQSVCPSNTKSGTTFVLLNKEGAQMKISLAPKKSESTEKTDDNKQEQENGQQSKNTVYCI